MRKVLVLNELHPNEQPGAATIAFEYALKLSQTMRVIYVFTSNSYFNSVLTSLQTKCLRRRRQKALPGYLGEFVRMIHDLFGIYRAIQYFLQIRKERPDLIWVHQIGNYIPRLILFILPFSTQVMMTLHDYSLIVPRKLYPEDLHSKIFSELGITSKNAQSWHSKKLMHYIKEVVYSLRRCTLRFYCRRVQIVCISEQQAKIYRSYGFRVSDVIANGIDECTCQLSPKVVRFPAVLFLGRINGKGLRRLLDSAHESGVKIILAGSEELRLFVEQFPKKINFTFLGHLNRTQVFLAIHEVSFVYVASECFDVFPTVGIEAIRHGGIPIVSETTGLSYLVQKIDPSLVIKTSENLFVLSDYMKLLNENRKELLAKLSLANNDISTVQQSLSKYISLM